MIILIKTIFIIQFILLIWYFIYTLFYVGFNFKLGFTFGVLYFIFIPINILIFTGKIPLVKTDFGSTTLSDVILARDIKASFLLIAYLFSIIFYLYFSKQRTVPDTKKITLKPKVYLLIYLINIIIIFIGSGLLEGGNWYSSRHNFMVKHGNIAVLLTYLSTAAKLLIIASLIYFWTKKKISTRTFFAYILIFTVLDMVFTGNRIYVFSTFAIIGLIFMKKYPHKIFIGLPIVLPLTYYVGYFFSIFRHIRGPLFQQGIPSFKVFYSAFERAVRLDPPNIVYFFLNISESVNVNVIYNIFNNFDKTLYGVSYLKLFMFYIPRSIWESKPESITKIVANHFGSASLVTTMIGEIHINFYYLGIILLPLLLYFTEYILYKIKFNIGLFNYVHFIMGILIFRMPFSDEILIYLFLVFILYVTNKKFVIKYEHFKNTQRESN